VNLRVGARVVHGGARLGDLVDRVVDSLARRLRIEALECLSETPDQEDFRPVVATERSIGTSVS